MSNKSLSAIEDQEKPPVLEDWQFKELLIDIEKLGGREETDNFLEVCNNNQRIYGFSGTDKRRQFQRALYNCKRCKPEYYFDLLLKHKVQPSAATLREVEEAEEAQQEQRSSGKFLLLS